LNSLGDTFCLFYEEGDDFGETDYFFISVLSGDCILVKFETLFLGLLGLIFG
jgi:hypothetical protein